MTPIRPALNALLDTVGQRLQQTLGETPEMARETALQTVGYRDQRAFEQEFPAIPADSPARDDVAVAWARYMDRFPKSSWDRSTVQFRRIAAFMHAYGFDPLAFMDSVGATPARIAYNAPAKGMQTAPVPDTLADLMRQFNALLAQSIPDETKRPKGPYPLPAGLLVCTVQDMPANERMPFTRILTVAPAELKPGSHLDQAVARTERLMSHQRLMQTLVDEQGIEAFEAPSPRRPRM